MGAFQKVCRVCHKEFESNARNTKYCGDECADKTKGIHAGRAKRRRDYKRNASDRRRQSMSRKQAREFCIAEHTVANCTRCGVALQIKELEDHHRDGNPFNNDKDNLTLHCGKCHPKSDAQWRKEKEDGHPISDVRKFTQIGTIVVDQHGDWYLTIPGVAVRTKLTDTMKEFMNAANTASGGN